MQGLIIENIANLYKIETKEKNNNEIYESFARGKFKKDEISPVVGDIVDFEITDKEKKKAIINKIYDRKVYIKRPKLSNITKIIFVVSSKNPKPDLLMLDKQLAFANFLGIEAIIVLNKSDLPSKTNENDVRLKKASESIINISALNKKGIVYINKLFQIIIK